MQFVFSSTKEGVRGTGLRTTFHPARRSVDRLEAVVRLPVERSTVMDLQPGVVEAGVAGHYSSRRVIEADRHSIFERVADKLGAIGIHDLERLYAPNNGVLLETVVPRPPRLYHIGRVGPEVRVGVVSGQGTNTGPCCEKQHTSR